MSRQAASCLLLTAVFALAGAWSALWLDEVVPLALRASWSARVNVPGHGRCWVSRYTNYTFSGCLPAAAAPQGTLYGP